jgi:cell division protein FtsW
VNAAAHTFHTVKGWFATRGSDGVGALPVRDTVDLGAKSGIRASRVLAFDQALVTVVGVLMALGMVMVYSASVALHDNPKFAAYSQTYFLQRHVFSLVVAFIAALVVVQVPISIWEKYAPHIFVLSLILLIVVLVPFIGKVVNF